jgi:putative ABC transport system permease protein
MSARAPQRLSPAEAFHFSIQALRANKVRTILTALGLVIGNAAVILVVTVSLTGRDLILSEIRAVGSNLIYAAYQAGSTTNFNADADYLKQADVDAIRQQLAPRIVAACGVMTNYDQMYLNGRAQDVAVIGSDDQYVLIRNLQLLAGRFLDPSDVLTRQKVAMLTEKLANKLFGGQQASIGQVIKIHQLRFTVIGTFKERTSTFGLSELRDETVLIPITVIDLFTRVERMDPIYVQARSADQVEATAQAVRQVIESRHRKGARYSVDTLTAILDAANRITFILSIVLFVVAAIALVISGIGIMNIMLVTVTERTREIGLRKAVGAPSQAILLQFLAESVMISVSGGFIGILIGISIPLSIQFFTDQIKVPVSPLSIIVAFTVSVAVGVIFGMLPARRASQLNPTEALRYE